ncbi:MAG: hypothetical protein A2X81_18715 [Desulfobacterales bacterium GWB2_56_26]|nr:MAG: hypothetical protein A2X81_18715 [Desulfobacterales bacterium GWB2_56_26]
MYRSTVLGLAEAWQEKVQKVQYVFSYVSIARIALERTNGRSQGSPLQTEQYILFSIFRHDFRFQA